jgi:hypothetical protein
MGKILLTVFLFSAFVLTDAYVHTWVVSFFLANDIIGHDVFLTCFVLLCSAAGGMKAPVQGNRLFNYI